MKKAQVTLFIILGIVVLVAAAIVFNYANQTSFEPELVEPRFEPVTNYVQLCIDDISKEAVKTIGLNGGYITFPDTIKNNPNAYLSFGPIKDFRNPYWWYEGIEAIPPEDFIRKQIADYVTEELEKCVANFTAFENQFNIIQDEISTDVILAEEDVRVHVTFPLLIKDKSDAGEAEVSRFIGRVPVRLKKMYDLAVSMMEKENADRFLEKKTIDLIALDNQIPDTDVIISCERTRWRIDDLRDRLQHLLAVNLPYIRIEGTSYENTYVPTPYGGTKFNESYYQEHYIWEVTDQKNEGMHVSITHDENYPMIFGANPNKGGYIQCNSQQGQEALSFLCIQICHFTYDIIYPVRVMISDEGTESHDDYSFIFAFKVSINHNQPFRENFATTVFEGIDSSNNEEFCNDVGEEITILTSDKVTGDPIADVNLTFACGIYDCDVGTTDWYREGPVVGAAAGLTKPMPYCVYGILSGKAEGYADTEMFIQTGSERTYELLMDPIKEFDDFEVVKHKYTYVTDHWVMGQEERLVSPEQATITITIPDTDFMTYAIYPDEYNTTLELYSAEDQTYKASVYLLEEE